MSRIEVHHIPVCPFSQRLEILLTLKAVREQVDFRVVDITRPRPAELLARMRGASTLPVLLFDDGRVLKESLVIMEYLDAAFPQVRVAQQDPWKRALEVWLASLEAPFVNAGYSWILNQDPAQRHALRERMLAQYARLNDFLVQHAPQGSFLFDDFGWAETVFAPMFMRFWFLDYYEGFALPETCAFARVRRWRDACVSHPAAKQVCEEEIVKLYYDYAKGAGNGALLPGRSRSSFAFAPHWRERPMPPRDKYAISASDEQLGLRSLPETA